MFEQKNAPTGQSPPRPNGVTVTAHDVDKAVTDAAANVQRAAAKVVHQYVVDTGLA
jgi:hypothetical protein